MTTFWMGTAAAPVEAICTGLPASVAEVAQSSKVIVVGTVTASRFDGAAYDLQVDQVVTGKVKVGRWSFGPTRDPGPRSGQCLADPMPVGQRVVVSISLAPVPNDHAFVDYFWWPVAADGTVGIRSTEQTEHTLAALLAALRAALPETDTASVAQLQPVSGAVLLALVVIAFAVSLWRFSRRQV
jgi:hypothetical protein